MTARYELRDLGVYDRKAQAVITPMSGAAWDKYHDWLAGGGAPDPMPAPAPLPLTEVLANRLADIEERAAQQRKKVTGAVSGQEMASWTLKRAEALAYDPVVGDISAPMLAEEAAARGVPTADIVARVRANAEGFSQAEAAIAGASGKHKDAMRALTTVGEVLAYDATVGWPFSPPALPTKLPQ